jgi:hypothetical protein
MKRLPASAIAVVAVISLGACFPPATPEAACERFLQGVREGDADTVFNALAQTTQWSLHTVAKSSEQMRDLIEQAYPAVERRAALARLPAGGGNGKALFRALYPQRYAPSFQRRLGQGAMTVTQKGPDRATCSRPGGEPFLLSRGPKGGWGMAELDDEWEQAKLRAVHDLSTVQENARLYKGGR